MSKLNLDWKPVRKYPLVEGKPTQPGRYWLWTPWITWTEVRVGEGADPMVSSANWPMSAWSRLSEMTDMAVWRGPIEDQASLIRENASPSTGEPSTHRRLMKPI